MVKSRLTVSVERSVTEESNWTQLGDLASGILRMAAERREKLQDLKAAVARDHASALQSSSGGIWLQLDLPLPAMPPASPPGPSRRSGITAARFSRP
jgi:hypothetical protein